jgi:hypothetical protein
MFVGSASVMALAVNPAAIIAIGDSAGGVHILSLRGVECLTPMVTLEYLYRFHTRQWDVRTQAPGVCGVKRALSLMRRSAMPSIA